MNLLLITVILTSGWMPQSDDWTFKGASLSDGDIYGVDTVYNVVYEERKHTCSICGKNWITYNDYDWTFVGTSVCGGDRYGVDLCEHCAKYRADIEAAVNQVIAKAKETERDRIQAIKEEKRREEIRILQDQIHNLQRKLEAIQKDR